MSVGDRLHRLAVRACLIAGVVLLTAGVGPCESQETTQERAALSADSPENAKSSGQQDNDAQADQNQPRVNVEATNLNPTTTAPASSPVKEGQRKGQKGAESDGGDTSIWFDSVAQWIMAITSIAATIVSAIAVMLVRRTLDATRELSAAENRAWLVIDKVDVITDAHVTSSGCQFKVQYFVKNIGKSPAFHIWPGAIGVNAFDEEVLDVDVLSESKNHYAMNCNFIRRAMFPDEI
jgi:hypothetical protein